MEAVRDCPVSSARGHVELIAWVKLCFSKFVHGHICVNLKIWIFNADNKDCAVNLRNDELNIHKYLKDMKQLHWSYS